MKFSNEFIDQVRQANDIVSVISEYVTLKRRGRNFWACCPFHNEKTASFSVSADKGFFYCFGCHAHGDVFQFIMMKDNLTFGEAVTRLAERAHMALPTVEKSAEEKRKEQFIQLLYKVNEMAGNFFHNCLTQTHYGLSGLDYFHRRGLSDETITSFKLGFAPDSWDKLTTAFTKNGIDSAVLVKLGLAKEKNGHFYDAFRNRVMFPIRDGRGRIVGFGGRVLDDSKPKYLNSPETPIFNKRRLLFALDLAHKAIYDAGKAVLVEGYMDVISAHNRGVSNVVASLGTALTQEQLRLLQRQTRNLVLSYDMDEAGRTATLRAMEMVRGLGMHVTVLSLPQGKDPDEYIKAFGPEAFRQAVSTAPNVLDYMFQMAAAKHDKATLEGKAAITAMIMPALAAEDNRIVIEGFMTKLAQQLQIDENAIRSEFNKYVTQHPETAQTEVQISTDITNRNQAVRGSEPMAVVEENILRYIMEHTDSFDAIYRNIIPSYFVNAVRRHIFEQIRNAYEEKKQYTQTDIRLKLGEQENSELARIMVLEDVPVDEAVIMDYAKRLRNAALQQEYDEHSKLAVEFSRHNDPQFIQEMAKCKDIKEQMKQWS